MKEIVFLGTCQIEAIANILVKLDFFNKIYHVKNIIKVYSAEIEEMNDFIQKMNEIDLVIFQPVSENYREGLFSTKRIKDAAERANVNMILVPYIFFNGYFPHIGYIKNESGQYIEKGEIIYHDKNIIKHLVEEIDISKAENTEYLHQTHDKKYHFERIYNILKRKDYYDKKTWSKFFNQ